MIVRLPLLTVISMLCFASAAGCSPTMFSGTGQRFSQDAEVDFAPPLKMKIERCYWTGSVDAAAALNIPPGAYRPDMTTKAQDAFLVVELAVVNRGSKPLMAGNPPVFQLIGADGVTYDADPRLSSQGAFATMGTNIGTNINPGRSEEAKLVFDVPKGQYELAVHRGQWVGNGFARGPRIWTWTLSPGEGAGS